MLENVATEPAQSPVDSPQDFGKDSERLVSAWLYSRKINGVRQDYADHFDLDCSGVRVEVKAARPGTFRGKTIWRFNLHRHGRLVERDIHFYILRLEAVPEFGAAVHLIIPAPIKRLTVHISLRSLLTKYASYFNNLKPLKAAIAKKAGVA